MRKIVRFAFVVAGFVLTGGAAIATPRTALAQCSNAGWSFSPCQSTITIAPGGTGTKTIAIQNNTYGYDGTGVYCAVAGVVTRCTVSPSSVALAAGASRNITVGITVGTSAGTGTVTLTNDFASEATITVTVPSNGPPVSAISTPSSYVNKGLCVTSCFDATYSYTTPTYTSMDAARGVTLAYRSALAHPITTVTLDATDTTTSGARQMSVKMWHNGVPVAFTNGTTESFFAAGPGSNRLTVQYDASSVTSGASNDSAVVTSYLNNGTVRTTGVRVRPIVLNESASALGAGWTLPGVLRGFVQANGDVIVADGSGSASYFVKQVGCTSGCSFTAPNGDFRSLSGPDYSTGNYSLRAPDGTAATLGGNGQVKSVSDRFGNTTSFAYDAGGRLTTITDPAGQVMTLAYGVQPASGATVLQSITTPGGRVTTVTIDGSGNLVRIDAPDGQPEFRGDYDSSHRLTHWLDRGSGDWNYTYDGAGRTASLIAPTVTADGAAIRPTVTYATIESATIALPGAGNGTSANPVPRVDTASLRARVTDERGSTTAYKLDALGAPLRVEEPLGRVTVMTRDYAERVTQVTTPSGDRVTYSYNGPDLVGTLDSYTGRSVRMDYEPTYHQVTRVYGDADSVWNYWSAGKLDSVRTGTSARLVTRYSYDARGRMTQSVDPNGRTTSLYYASAGWQNTDSVVVAGHRRSAQHFNSWGLVDQVTDPAGNVAQTIYDALGRPRFAIGPRSDTTTYYYTGDFLSGVRDARGQLWSYTRNVLGWPVQDVDPAGLSTYRLFDRGGNVTVVTTRRGETIRFSYDALGNLTTRSVDGGGTDTFSTDPLGMFVTASNGESTDTVKYDPAGRATSEISVRGAVRYERTSSYNVRGERTGLSVVAPWTFGVGYHYDAMMRLDTLTDAAGGRTSIAYDAADQPTSLVLPNGLSVSTPFANVTRPESIGYSDATVNSSQGVSYAYGSRGELTDRVNAAGTAGREYRMDATGQNVGYADYTLASGGCYMQPMPPDPPERVCPGPSKTYGSSVTYGWDLVGNPTHGGAITATGDRLIRFGADSLVYDANGNLVTRYRNGALYQTLTWNALGQLVSVTTSGATVSFGYDAFGRRVRKTTPSGVRYYLHDGDDLLAEYDGSGALVARYTYYPGVDEPHSVVRGGGGASGVHYYLQDAAGNITALVGSTGALENQYSYLPFGSPETKSETVENPLQFSARELDAETGLYYVRARYYDATLGRFISEDPIGLSGGINPYSYAGNDPLDQNDPSGMWPPWARRAAAIWSLVANVYKGIQDFKDNLKELVPTAWVANPPNSGPGPQPPLHIEEVPEAPTPNRSGEKRDSTSIVDKLSDRFRVGLMELTFTSVTMFELPDWTLGFNIGSGGGGSFGGAASGGGHVATLGWTAAFQAWLNALIAAQ